MQSREQSFNLGSASRNNFRRNCHAIRIVLLSRSFLWETCGAFLPCDVASSACIKEHQVIITMQARQVDIVLKRPKTNFWWLQRPLRYRRIPGSWRVSNRLVIKTNFVDFIAAFIVGDSNRRLPS